MEPYSVRFPTNDFMGKHLQTGAGGKTSCDEKGTMEYSSKKIVNLKIKWVLALEEHGEGEKAGGGDFLPSGKTTSGRLHSEMN